MELHQTKKLLHIKGGHRQNIRQPTKWEAWSQRVGHNLATEQLNGKKIFANYISYKGFISKIYKELRQLNSKTI